ncbi:hypothetical protein [uncultured Fibrella sp.]|uniref:hypothetical protein n=1 Tax=uncultured Fibrella sp. TaxID=1284596 RepID=UPI0035CA80E2
MALYIEQRIDQLEAHAVEDGKLLETVAKGLATLTVEFQKDREQAQQNHESTNRRIDETNLRIDETNLRVDETNLRIDHLRDDMNQQFNGVRQDISDVKVTQALILKILTEKL